MKAPGTYPTHNHPLFTGILLSVKAVTKSAGFRLPRQNVPLFEPEGGCPRATVRIAQRRGHRGVPLKGWTAASSQCLLSEKIVYIRSETFARRVIPAGFSAFIPPPPAAAQRLLCAADGDESVPRFPLPDGAVSLPPPRLRFQSHVRSMQSYIPPPFSGFHFTEQKKRSIANQSQNWIDFCTCSGLCD